MKQLILEDEEARALKKILEETLKDVKQTINNNLNHDITDLSKVYDTIYRINLKLDFKGE